MESATTISTIDRAEELLTTGDTQPALDMVRTLYGQTLSSTDRGRALAIEAVCLVELDQADTAEKLVAEVMKDEGDDLAFVLAAGIEFSDLGEHGQAEVFLRNLIELDPGNHLVWFNLAINFGREERYLEAAEAYEKCLALNAEFPEAYVQRAFCMEAMNNLEAAAAMYRAYLERMPDDDEVWKSLGIVESERKRFDEAYAAFEKALGCADEPEDIWFNWAITAVRREDEETLERCISQLQDLNPEGWRTLLARADYEEAQGHVWPAWELLAEALETALEDEDEEDEAAGYVGAALLRFANRNDMREHAAEHVLRLFEESVLTEDVIEALQALEGRMSNAAVSFQVILRGENQERPVYLVYGVSADSADEAGRLALAFQERCAPEPWALHSIHQLGEPDEGRVGVYWRSRLYNRPPGS